MDTNHIFPPDYDRDRIGRGYAEFAERYGYQALIESIAGATVDFSFIFWPHLRLTENDQNLAVIVRAAERAAHRAIAPAELAVLIRRSTTTEDDNLDTLHLVARGLERCLTIGAMS